MKTSPSSAALKMTTTNLLPKHAIAQPSPISIRDFSTPTVPTGHHAENRSNSHDRSHGSSSKNLIRQFNFAGAATAFASTPLKQPDHAESAISLQSKQSSDSSQSSVLSEGVSWYDSAIPTSDVNSKTKQPAAKNRLISFENLFTCGTQSSDVNRMERQDALRRKNPSKAPVMKSPLMSLDEEEETMNQIMAFTKGEAILNIDETSVDGTASIAWVLSKGDRTEVKVAEIHIPCCPIAEDEEHVTKEEELVAVSQQGTNSLTVPVNNESVSQFSYSAETSKSKTSAGTTCSQESVCRTTPVKKLTFFKSIWRKQNKKDYGEF